MMALHILKVDNPEEEGEEDVKYVRDFLMLHFPTLLDDEATENGKQEDSGALESLEGKTENGKHDSGALESSETKTSDSSG